MTQPETGQIYHIPVLLQESLDGLDIKPEGIYVDVTFGGGGHSRGILERLGKQGRLYGFDQDADAERNIPDDDRFVFVRGNFRYLANFLRYHEVKEVDGILADLGVSWHHFDDASRGFSFRSDSPLDMRMNNRKGRTAADVLNKYDEEALARVFFLYGELKNSRRIASEIARARLTKPFETTGELTEILKPFAGKDRDRQFFAKAFQALRIEVNGELEALEEFLVQAKRTLKAGGRLAVITYHSLEDRMVKNFFKTGNIEGRIETDVYGNKPSPFAAASKAITPSEEEMSQNPRARSAKLRVGELKIK